MPIDFQNVRINDSGWKTLRPNAKTILNDLGSFANDVDIEIVGIFTTQAENCEYTYIGDGRKLQVPFPLGTPQLPFYPCRDIGGWLRCRENFQITVQSSDDNQHIVRSVVLYLERRSR